MTGFRNSYSHDQAPPAATAMTGCLGNGQLRRGARVRPPCRCGALLVRQARESTTCPSQVRITVKSRPHTTSLRSMCLMGDQGAGQIWRNGVGVWGGTCMPDADLSAGARLLSEPVFFCQELPLVWHASSCCKGWGRSAAANSGCDAIGHAHASRPSLRQDHSADNAFVLLCLPC